MEDSRRLTRQMRVRCRKVCTAPYSCENRYTMRKSYVGKAVIDINPLLGGGLQVRSSVTLSDNRLTW